MWSEKATFIRFAVVGIGNTIVDFGVFFLLISMGVSYMFAQLCSYSAGVMNSYVWNRKWTFRVLEKASVQQFFQFVIVNIISLSATVMLLKLLQLTAISLFVSKAIATIVGMAINFIGNRFWVFSSGQEKEGSKKS
ncbi:GtrA family protein [Anoxybacillus sp.]|uniref:GtrA family protein n=1 Tax=Anoxybacillus sp. TaxID=1872573 RepID=UPI00262DB699|nr:GtrA family protein [uncultured Anoxybacillus sp.]